MADHSQFPIASDPHSVPVTFVNELESVGFLNGVVNINFLTARFTAVSDRTGAPAEVVADMVVGARLRFDLALAMHLHSQLGALIEANTKGVAQPAPKADPRPN